MVCTYKEHNAIGKGTSGASVFASYAKDLAQWLVADVSWLSVDTTTSDTSTLFDQTLTISWDNTIKLRVYNENNRYIVGLKYDGNEYSSGFGGKESTQMHNTYVIFNDKILFICTNGSTSSSPVRSCIFFLCKEENYYDNHTAIIKSSDSSLGCTSYFPMTTITDDGAVNTYNSSTAAYAAGNVSFPVPYYNWSGAGHLYAAVPRMCRIARAEKSIIGSPGGNDAIYAVYDNGNSLNVSAYSQFSINGHTFFRISGSDNIWFRIS